MSPGSTEIDELEIAHLHPPTFMTVQPLLKLGSDDGRRCEDGARPARVRRRAVRLVDAARLELARGSSVRCVCVGSAARTARHGRGGEGGRRLLAAVFAFTPRGEKCRVGGVEESIPVKI